MINTPTSARHAVRFLFDPVCPWTWLTSIWMRDVRDQGLVDVTWQPYSLEFINRKHTDTPYVAHMRENRPMFRVMQLIKEAVGNEAVGMFYLALGEAHHERGLRLTDPSVLSAALQEAGLDPSLTRRAADEANLDDALTAAYQEAERAGAFAVPSIFVDGQAKPFFGPVIGETHSGEEARRIWESVLTLTELPYFFELKRNR